MSQGSFIQRLYSLIQSQYDLTHQELTVVFPNKRAAYYLRNEFKKNGHQTIWLPQIMSIEEAVTQWSGFTLADNIDLLFELVDIDAELHMEQNSDLSVFGSQAAQMAKDFDEIDQYGIDAKHVFNYVVENKRLEYWNFDEERSKEKEQKYLNFFKSLYDYYLRLHDRLNLQGKGYYGMITRHLSELPEDELVTKIGSTNIIFAGFNALTTTEERIINTLIRNGKAEILFDYDRYYVDDENNEAGHFARKYLLTHPDWLKNGFSEALSTEKKNIHIVSASGNTLQAKALQANLQTNQNKGQTIVLADEHLLIPVLNSIPDVEAYTKFNVSMGYSIKNTPVNQLIRYYFTLQRRKMMTRDITVDDVTRAARGWYFWLVIRLMDLEIVKIALPKKETAAFDRWKKDEVNQGKFIFEETDFESLEMMPNVCKFLKITLVEQNTKAPSEVLCGISQVLAFLVEIVSQKEEKERYYFLLNQLSEVGKTIERLSQIVQDKKNYIKDLQSLEILYRLLSSSATVKLSGSGTEGLQIMGLLETRNLDFNQLHVLSVNEGIMPPDKSQGSFIPQYIRRECGLPGYAEGQAVVAYHFYRLLQNGTDIYLYYNNLDETSGGEPSRYILQIKHELAKNSNITMIEESVSSKAKASMATQALQADKAGVRDRLLQLIQERGLSPSSLSTYIQCPLKYYLKYIEQIKDDSIEEDVGRDVVGRVIHKTLELLFGDYLPKDGKLQVINKDMFDKQIQPQWQKKLAQAISEEYPNGFPDVGFNSLNKVNIEQQLKTYLNYTSKQLGSNDLVMISTEEELRAQLATPTCTATFHGFADRIDRFGGVTRVIDYKTGKVDNANLKLPVRHQGDSDLDYLKQSPEKALQLLLYKYMYLKQHPEMLPEQVSGAIHGLKYVKGIEFSLVKATPSSKDTDTDTNFLEDNSFISDMETMLKAVVDEMLDEHLAFVQAEDDDHCGYCEFRMICKR